MARRAERTLGNISRGGPPIASLARLHSSKTTLGAVVEAFFADRDLAPATRRAYQATYGSLLQAFGTEMPFTAIKLRRWLTRRWGKAAAVTWNARLTASRVLIGYCQRQGWLERDPATCLERRRTPRDETPGRSPSRRSRRCGRAPISGCARKPCGACSTPRPRGSRPAWRSRWTRRPGIHAPKDLEAAAGRLPSGSFGTAR